MRLTLVDNFIVPEGGNLDLLDIHPHLGLLSLAAIATRAGHEVQIYDPKRQVRFGQLTFDPQLYENVTHALIEQQPEVVGFTTLGCSFIFVLNVARLLKEHNPDLPILLGGPHATMLHRRIVEEFPQIDVVVRHEAEETLPRILANLDSRNFQDIPGITWRRPHSATVEETPGRPMIEDLDSLPGLTYDLYPVEDLGLDLMRIEAGRGCPYACTFCSTATFFQRSYRLKSPDRLVQELDMLHERYGVTEFKLDHDMFTVDWRKVMAFCEVVKDRGYQWRVSARVDRVDRDLLERMAEAGCIGLYFGIETGSQRMQKIAKKGLGLEDVQPKLDICEELGIETTISFITGYPDEILSDQEDTLNMIGRAFCRPGSSTIPQLHILTPEPGTLLFTQHADKMEFDGYTTAFNGSLLNDEDRRLVLAYPDLFSSYYYYPGQLPRLIYTFAVDVFDVIRVVGRTALGYTLRHFDGSLASLVARIRQWAVENQRQETIDRQLVLDFISQEFGPDHHLVSLYRYSFCLNSIHEPDEADIIGGAWRPKLEPEAPYQLNPQCYLFRDLHDCKSLLERIRQDPEGQSLYEDSSVGARGCHVLVMKNGVAEYSAVDPGVLAILEMFEEPVSCNEVNEAIAEATGGSRAGMEFFENLLRSRIIVLASQVGELQAAAATQATLEHHHVC